LTRVGYRVRSRTVSQGRTVDGVGRFGTNYLGIAQEPADRDSTHL